MFGSAMNTNALYIAQLVFSNPPFHFAFPISLVKPLIFILGAGEAASALGVANEKNWGYRLATVLAGLGLLETVILFVQGGFAGGLFNTVLVLIFEVALLATLVHPMSREYRKIWFK